MVKEGAGSDELRPFCFSGGQAKVSMAGFTQKAHCSCVFRLMPFRDDPEDFSSGNKRCRVQNITGKGNTFALVICMDLLMVESTKRQMASKCSKLTAAR